MHWALSHTNSILSLCNLHVIVAADIFFSFSLAVLAFFFFCFLVCAVVILGGFALLSVSSQGQGWWIWSTIYGSAICGRTAWMLLQRDRFSIAVVLRAYANSHPPLSLNAFVYSYLLQYQHTITLTLHVQFKKVECQDPREQV
jgi:hypothetical protein